MSDAISDTSRFGSLRQGYRIGDHLWRGLLLVWRRAPPLRLNATAARSIGLTLHELATNAGKHGALSTNTGYVDIGWGTEGDTFTISWMEREGYLHRSAAGSAP